MKCTEADHNYHIFKCRFPGCNEIIPVESITTSPVTSMGRSYLQSQGVATSHDLMEIDATCPYCSMTNRFQVKDRIRDISKQEYDEQNHAVKSKFALIRVTYKVLQS